MGTALLHMEQVQVHPTGFVDPADPAAGTKVRCMDLQGWVCMHEGLLAWFIA
jgi:succinate dehydrogenase/fumarate reductase flavoprotein subunit